MVIEHITGNLYLLSITAQAGPTQTHFSTLKKTKLNLSTTNSMKLGWQKQQASQSCAGASGETTTLSLTVTLLINTPASAGVIIAPASPVILYLTCCYCQTPSPLRETEIVRDGGGGGAMVHMCECVLWSWKHGRCCLCTVRYKLGYARGCSERKEKEKIHARKSNECVLLNEIPGARLRGADGGKSCSFRWVIRRRVAEHDLLSITFFERF